MTVTWFKSDCGYKIGYYNVVSIIQVDRNDSTCTYDLHTTGSDIPTRIVVKSWECLEVRW